MASRPTSIPCPAGAYFADLPIGQVSPNQVQPRQVFEEEAMAELVHSIQEVGLLQPVVVRRTGEESYELVMGERRWRAAQEAGLDTIPAIVRQTEDADMLRDALLENLHRSQLNPLEEAAAYQQLLEDFSCTHDELASRIGRSRPQISNTIRLLKLSPAVQRRVAAGVISAGHARSLLAVDDADLQDRLAARVVAEGISVRGLEELVAVGETGSAGADDGTPAQAHRSRVWTDLAERLSDRLETRVKVDLGQRKGRIIVEFASLDDLRRIVDIMDPRNRTDRPDLSVIQATKRQFIDMSTKRCDRYVRPASPEPARRRSAASSRVASAGSVPSRRTPPAPTRHPPRAGGRTGSRSASRARSVRAQGCRLAQPGRRPVTRRAAAPTRIVIAVPREKSRAWSLVIIRWVPHSTIGTSGTPARGGDPDGAGLELLDLHRPRDRGLGKDADQLARGQVPGGQRQRRLAVGTVDLDVPAGPHHRAGDPVVEELALGHEPHPPADPVGCDPAVDEVDVPDVVDSEQSTARAREVVEAGDVDRLTEQPGSRAWPSG